MEENIPHRGKRKRSEDLTVTKLSQSETFVNHFSEIPSLHHIATVSVAIKLWTEPKVKNELMTLTSCDKADFCELEESILNRLFNSSLPHLLKTELSYVITPIRLQLSKVFCNYCTCTGYRKKLCDYFMKGSSIYWTIEGTIDVKKPLIELFNYETSESDICCLYEAACFYCLEEYISVLWKKIPAQTKSQFRVGRVGDVYKYHIAIYWTSVIENNLDFFLNKIIRIDYENIYDPNLSINLNMVTCSIRIGGVFALKYFWEKLTEQEKNDHLNKWLSQATQGIKQFQSSVYEKFNESLDVLCFLLSHIHSKIVLSEYFQDHPLVLMLIFQTWPFRRMFLPTILDLLNILHEDVYVAIMKDIGSKLSKEGIEIKMFKVIWSASPQKLKRAFLQKKMISADVILYLLESENLSMALMLINDASEEEIKQIICHLFGWSKFCAFVYTKNLQLLCELLSKTTLPPECNFYAFRHEWKEGMQLYMWYNEWHMCNEWLKGGHFQVVEIFLNWAFQSADEVQNFKKKKLNPCIMYTTFVIMRDYGRVEKFLNWYFEAEEKIQQFQKKFILDDNNCQFKFLLSELCSRPCMAWNILEKFISFCSLSPEEITEVKFICLNYVETVLQKRCYEFATMLLNWCLDRVDEVKRYKNDFVLSEKGIKKILFYKKLRTTDRDWDDMENLIKWSLPLSRETIAEVKSLIHAKEPFYSSESEKNLKVLALLDSMEFGNSSNCDSHLNMDENNP